MKMEEDKGLRPQSANHLSHKHEGSSVPGTHNLKMKARHGSPHIILALGSWKRKIPEDGWLAGLGVAVNSRVSQWQALLQRI